jgi:hypothetical protein
VVGGGQRPPIVCSLGRRGISTVYVIESTYPYPITKNDEYAQSSRAFHASFFRLLIPPDPSPGHDSLSLRAAYVDSSSFKWHSGKPNA